MFLRTLVGDYEAPVGDSLFTLSRSIGEVTLREEPEERRGAVAPAFLARLHTVLAQELPDGERSNTCPPMWQGLEGKSSLDELAASCRDAGLRRRAFLAALDEVGAVRALGASVEIDATPRGPVHGDFWPGNLVLTEADPQGLGVVDFDNAFDGPLLLDVAQYVDLRFAVFAGHQKQGIDLEKATEFARQYAVAMGHPATVLPDLPVVLLRARISSILWVIECHLRYGPSPLDALLENDIRVIRFVREKTAMWQELLVSCTAPASRG